MRLRCSPGLLAVCVALACFLSGPARAEIGDDGAAALTLRSQMLRLADVDWRLRVAARPLCAEQVPGHGLWLDHSLAYITADREMLLQTLRLGQLPQVAAVASGSPADRAGIRTGDEIDSIEELKMADALANSPDPSLFAEDVMDLLATTPSEHPLRLTLRRGRMTLSKTIETIPICAGRTFLDSAASLEAHTDNRDLAVSSALVEFTANDDELAFIVGHEMAHGLLRAPLPEMNIDPVSLERQADALGSVIAFCAGYEMLRAAEFWSRFERQDALAQARLRTHPVPGDRKKNMLARLHDPVCPIPAALLDEMKSISQRR